MDEFYVSILSVSIVSVSIIWYIKSLLKPARRAPPLPPGPRGLPIVGYMPFLGSNLVQQFMDLGQKYGPIYKLWLGNKLCVVISSPELVKEVVRDKDAIFANRDVPVAAFVCSYGGNDISFAPNNSQWRLMRKVFVREMLSTSNLEASYSFRRDEVRKAIKHVYVKVGKLINIGELSFQTEMNVVMNMLWGGTVEGKERESVGDEFRTLTTELVDLLAKPNVSDFFPVLAWLDIQGVKKQMEGYVQSIDRIMDKLIADHQKKFSGENKPQGKNFLQILLELKERTDLGMSITEQQMKAMLMDIVGGGTDTTATTLEWVMAELMGNPGIMAKVKKELSDVVGMVDMVEEFHIPKLKYMEAIVKETLRLHPAIPLLVPRSPSESSTIGGYTIPEGTRILINVPSIHKDPSIWDNPMEFKPERFLNDHDGKWDLSGNNFHFLPFGSGRRVCAGIPLAEKMLVYVLASLLHSFEWKLPQGEKLDMSEKFGIVMRKNIPLLAIPSPRLSDPELYL